MQTPNSKAGRLTELILFQWLENCRVRGEKNPTTGQYNAAYEATLNVLMREET
jgi:hypothetical protein